MANGGPNTAPAGSGGPRPAPTQPPQNEAKRDLASWWKQFKRSDKKAPDAQQVQPGIFGVPLQQSIRYANVAISLYNEEGQSYIYGYVPIVVAKCGVFLKEKATDVEGIFRLAGSEKRIKELKTAFDSPDRYGKGLDWTGYTVHDAANILRRYFNQLPEPIIPLDFYERFRDPLKNHQAEAVGTMESQNPSTGNFDQEGAIRAYQALITELPPLNRQLLLYILDLLAVFADKSDLNKMTTANLAAIFQPGLLSHPQHDMAPQEYRLSQDVLIFLIENQDSFLIGMPGTAADTQTVKDVQSGGTPPSTPSRSKTVLGRSVSGSTTASAGAQSVRKFGSVRRNVSVSSKHSKKSEGGPTPVPATPGSPSGGVHRSNTVPSRRPGSGGPSPRFSREKTSGPPTPNAASTSSGDERQGSIQNTPVATQAPHFPAPVEAPAIHSPSSSEATTPLAPVGSEASSALAQDYQTPKRDTIPLLSPSSTGAERTDQRHLSNTSTGSASGTRGFLDLFKQSPTNDADSQRRPNKLQKKRIPGSSLSSAHSSSHSLHNDGSADPSHQHRSPVSPVGTTNNTRESPRDMTGRLNSQHVIAQPTPTHTAQSNSAPQRMPTDATLRPSASPTQSYTSHTDNTDVSDADLAGDENAGTSQERNVKEKKKRHRWFSRSQNRLVDDATRSPPLNAVGGNKHELAKSRSTIGSSNAGDTLQRRSFQAPTALNTGAPEPSTGVASAPQQILQPSSTDPVFSDSERERRGPMSWIKGKLQERREKEKESEKRARTPDRNRDRGGSKQDLHLTETSTARGDSLEQQRQASTTSNGMPAHPDVSTSPTTAADTQSPTSTVSKNNVDGEAMPTQGASTEVKSKTT